MTLYRLQVTRSLKSKVILTSTVFLTLLTGCGNAEPIDPVPLPEQNIDLWVMPMDQYQAQWADNIREEYAQAVLNSECMQAAGFEFVVPWRDLTGSVARPHLNSVGRVVFTRELAEKYGYHRPASPESTLGEWLAYGESLNGLPADQQAALDSCFERTYEVLPPLNGEANRVAGIAQTAWDGALEDDAVLAGAARWRECMLPLGIPDLPDRPLQMPPASLGVDYTTSPLEEPTVSSAEISIATHDFDCRVSSGFRDALYEAEWERQVDLVNANIDDLVRSQHMFIERREQVNEILGLAPTEQ